MKIRQYSKSIIALLGGLGTALTVVQNFCNNSTEWLPPVISIATAVGVFLVPNKQAA